MTNSIPQSPDPSIPQSSVSSQMLLESLLASPTASLDDLVARFGCTLQDITAALDSAEFLTRFKLQTRLSYIQSRLAAARHVPEALQKTITLMHESEKPEVARRAASALIQMAGLPIRTRAQDAPTPMPEPPPPPEKEITHTEAYNEMAGILLARECAAVGINLKDLSDDDMLNAIRGIVPSHSPSSPQQPHPAPPADLPLEESTDREDPVPPPPETPPRFVHAIRNS